jgi:glycosyltransferase involved in cell wall biosynthesis
MKIAIDIREAGQGKTGKGWYTFNLVNELLKIDTKNHYLLYTDSDQNPFGSHKNAIIKKIEAKSWKWHLKTLKDLQNEKVDLFFAPTSYIIPAFLPKSIKSAITVHDLVAFLYPTTHNTKATLIERLTLKRALKKAHIIFAVSENTKKDLLKRFKFLDAANKKIYLTPCAPSDFFKKEIKPHELEEVQKKLKLPNNYILAVGTLEPRKNFTTLIKSFVIIKRKHPEYKLVIVGKKGWKYEQIEQTLKHYKMEKEVIFTGYLSDDELQKVYALATVFVFPSLYEGFGIPPLEAMSCGCPVVSSNVASLPEVVGEAGLLIDPKNAFKMAEAISSLIVNDHVRLTLIERGKQQANKFNWSDSAHKALNAFNELNI